MRNLARVGIEELQGRAFITVILPDCSTGSSAGCQGVSESFSSVDLLMFINIWPEPKSPFKTLLNFRKVWIPFYVA